MDIFLEKKNYKFIFYVFLHLYNYYILCHIFFEKLKSFKKIIFHPIF